ncbi:hypothetical protein LIG30_3486 [Burkholderia sp. lig30]|uniref:nitrogen fixation protein n=1 Tax=Burkholderia sp. lig30 TaxID=1192124 RepID=UPI0004619F5B|nr:nitrogen fixation protein [Burkholderia sp. lig30]KDB07240.1 hypothetical protein LIG30_3486 [Burkholderia sp. lig30]
MKPATEQYSCPSGQPDMPEARVFAIVGGTAGQPEVSYLKSEAHVPVEDVENTGLDPNLVFRIAARCDGARCGNYDGGRCSLGKKIVAELIEVVDVAPPCQIRATCRWFAENSYAACLRCPQVVTLSRQPDTKRTEEPGERVGKDSELTAL